MQVQLGQVDRCPDIGHNVRRFLQEKSKNSFNTFLPFEVQKVQITPKKRSLVDCRNLYKTAYSDKRAEQQPLYMQPTKQAKSHRSASSVSRSQGTGQMQHFSANKSVASARKRSSRIMRGSEDGRSILSNHNDEVMLQTFYTNKLFNEEQPSNHPRSTLSQFYTEGVNKVLANQASRFAATRLMPAKKRLKMIRLMQQQQPFAILEEKQQSMMEVNDKPISRGGVINRSMTAQNHDGRKRAGSLLRRMRVDGEYSDQRHKMMLRTTHVLKKANRETGKNQNAKIDSRETLKMLHNPDSNMFQFNFNSFSKFADTPSRPPPIKDQWIK